MLFWWRQAVRHLPAKLSVNYSVPREPYQTSASHRQTDGEEMHLSSAARLAHCCTASVLPAERIAALNH